MNCRPGGVGAKAAASVAVGGGDGPSGSVGGRERETAASVTVGGGDGRLD